jgi:hypothetical protein
VACSGGDGKPPPIQDTDYPYPRGINILAGAQVGNRICVILDDPVRVIMRPRRLRFPGCVRPACPSTTTIRTTSSTPCAACAPN